jgi:hypothetical protein
VIKVVWLSPGERYEAGALVHGGRRAGTSCTAIVEEQERVRALGREKLCLIHVRRV